MGFLLQPSALAGGAHAAAPVAALVLATAATVIHRFLMAVALGLGTTAAIVLLRLLNRRVPGALLAMVGGIVLDYTFGLHDRGMKVIADIAPVRGQLPPWTWPNLAHVELLVPAAIAASSQRTSPTR